MLGKGEAGRYGRVLAATAFTSALAGFTLNVDHVGWVVGAALLVVRPSHELQEVRSIGRIVAVYIGALVAAPLIVLGAPTWVFALTAPAVPKLAEHRR